jgi:quercetin dioxygenase-like cupin family protein
MLLRMTPRVSTEAIVAGNPLAPEVEEHLLATPQSGSALALSTLRLGPGRTIDVAADGCDTLLFTFAGEGAVEIAGIGAAITAGTAALAVDGEPAAVTAGSTGLAAVRMHIGPDVDLHAPIGPRDHVVSVDHVEPGTATGSRSFQVLFGAHNGSTRATLFVGYIPPGRAPWHYHLYDEIVWVWRGTGRLHLDSQADDLGAGAGFRLAPREVHIVENSQPTAELAVLGLFTPAGSPSAAYLTATAAATYGFSNS